MISGPRLRHTWRTHRVRLGIIALSLGIWAFLMPVIYATFGREMETLLKSGIIPDAFLRLMGADPFQHSDGSAALGAVHPIAIALEIVYPVGFAAAAIAGERQRGTLEVLLSRPVSRRSLYVTLLLAVITRRDRDDRGDDARDGRGRRAVRRRRGDRPGGDGAPGAEHGAPAGGARWDLAGRVRLLRPAHAGDRDRAGGDAGGAYALEILGTLWPDAASLAAVLALFHYLHPLEILGGKASPEDFLVLATVLVA